MSLVKMPFVKNSRRQLKVFFSLVFLFLNFIKEKAKNNIEKVCNPSSRYQSYKTFLFGADSGAK
jgi:hypothetical protein